MTVIIFNTSYFSYPLDGGILNIYFKLLPDFQWPSQRKLTFKAKEKYPEDKKHKLAPQLQTRTMTPMTKKKITINFNEIDGY